MSPFSLPPDLRLRELRRHAKDLCRIAADGDARVLAKFAAISKEPSLTSAQLLIAREFGFASWTKLRQQVLRNEADPGCAAVRRGRKRDRHVPQEELPAVVPIGRFVAVTPRFTLAIRSIRVHSICCLLDLDWVARRTTESTEVWKGLQRTIFCNLIDPWPGWEEFGDRPFLALTYADGREVCSDSDHWERRAQAEPEVDVPILRTVGGGSSSAEADDDHHATTRLYLSPLPPAGDLTVTFAWPAFGVSRARSVIDAGQLQVAARRVRTFQGGSV